MYITIIDNTDLGNGIKGSTCVSQQENSMRLRVPNEGVNAYGARIIFYSHGLRLIQGRHWVDPDNIIMRNGFILKPGIVVQKIDIAANNGNVQLDTQPFFNLLI